MGEALYRKYRPKTLTDVIGQDHITTTLTNAVASKKVRHGYLFSGPRGVGKTSVARILAHLVNNFEYSKPSGQLDIIEIDAASNRRIDEIRELRDKVHIAPSMGQYKVYIIDEVHMLTREAFNALLKILEEPPAHAIFILATTEAHKLPATIISRTQHFTFKPVQPEHVALHLKDIAKKEKITISDTAALWVAEYGRGSFRDSISLLDQLSNHTKISEDEVLQTIGGPDPKLIADLRQTLFSGLLSDLITKLNQLYNDGIDPTLISNSLMEKLRHDVLSPDNNNPRDSLELIKQLLTVQSSHSPGRHLEVILSDYCLGQTQLKTDQKSPNQSKETKANSIADTLSPKKETTTKLKTATKPAEAPSMKIKRQTSASANKIWETCLNSLKNKHNTLYGLSRMAIPTLIDDELHLAVPYAFHKKRLEEKKNHAFITELTHDITGQDLKLVITVKEKSTIAPNEEADKYPTQDAHTAITDIFGGGEVIET